MASVGRFGIGTRGDAGDVFASSDPWIGDIREVIIYSGRLTPQLEQRVEGYLAHKWNIALASGHPYAFAPPMVGSATSLWPLTRYTQATLNVTARRAAGYLATPNPRLPIIR
jgi:hypothetical protein